MPNTIMLTIVASALTWIISVPIGVYSAARRDSILDQGIRVVTFTLYSMPIFLIGYALFLTLGTGWRILPSQFNIDPILLPTIPRAWFDDKNSVSYPTHILAIDAFLHGDWTIAWNAFLHVILPSVALALALLAGIIRILRASMLEVLEQDYVRLARAKGVPERLANKTAVAGLVIFLVFMGDALIVQIAPGVLGVTYPNDVIPPQFTLTNPECDNMPPEPPSLSHPFGTFEYGQQGIGCLDLLQLVMKAIRIDIAIAFFIVLVGAAIGTLLGVVSGYVGKWLDEVLMRVTDVFFSVPFLILALAVGYVIGRTLFNMALALIIIWWPLYARYGRSLTLTTKEATFIESARASGSGRLKIMFRHLLPNVLPPILVQISLDVGTVILIFSTLAFIGFLPSNVLVPELGAIANFGLDLAPLGFWWTVVAPGGVITLFALAVNLMGDGLRDVIDPRRRS